MCTFSESLVSSCGFVLLSVPLFHLTGLPYTSWQGESSEADLPQLCWPVNVFTPLSLRKECFSRGGIPGGRLLALCLLSRWVPLLTWSFQQQSAAELTRAPLCGRSHFSLAALKILPLLAVWSWCVFAGVSWRSLDFLHVYMEGWPPIWDVFSQYFFRESPLPSASLLLWAPQSTHVGR